MPRYIYYLISFIAGGALMACELLVARLIAPYYGASLYVWAATIGTTLIGLASGYFYSGELAKKTQLSKKLFLITLITAAYLMILPMYSGFVMDVFMQLHVIAGIIISTFIFNMPLFFLFGLFSPLLIHLLKDESDNSGTYAGIIYGVSTISGVLFLVLTGVYAMPIIGTIASIYMLGGMLLVLSGIQFLMIKKGG